MHRSAFGALLRFISFTFLLFACSSSFQFYLISSHIGNCFSGVVPVVNELWKFIHAVGLPAKLGLLTPESSYAFILYPDFRSDHSPFFWVVAANFVSTSKIWNLPNVLQKYSSPAHLSAFHCESDVPIHARASSGSKRRCFFLLYAGSMA